MKAFPVQVEEIREAINIRLENYSDAVDKYHSERARLREVYFSEGFREDIAEQKSVEETKKIKQKIEALHKELDTMIVVLRNIDPDKIKEEQQNIAKKYNINENTEGRERTKGALIVEDAALMRKTIKDALASGSVAVAGEAENGRIGIEKYKELLPELVILDITMPEVDGMEVLKVIREFDPEARIIMCSQVTKQATIEEALRLGALNFIAKPFKPDKVLSIVKSALK
jgi:two-component system chemotaxis response regulator CheY